GKFDWYVGICPTHSGYLEEKLERLVRVVTELQPDGLFLQFIRFPGFWEAWTPDYAFADADRFCFCDRCRQFFAEESGAALPHGDLRRQARFILDQQAENWNAWRSHRIVEAVRRIASATGSAGTPLPIMINTLPFPRAAFDDLDARRT